MLELNGSKLARTVTTILTSSEIDTVRKKIAKCWIFYVGPKGETDIAIDVQMKLAPDGTVIRVEILDKERFVKDPFLEKMLKV